MVGYFGQSFLLVNHFCWYNNQVLLVSVNLSVSNLFCSVAVGQSSACPSHYSCAFQILLILFHSQLARLIKISNHWKKLKRGLGLAFGGYFLHNFSKKNCSLFNTLSMDKVSLLYFFPFQDIKQNVLLNSYLDR